MVEAVGRFAREDPRVGGAIVQALSVVLESFVAGIVASIACGLGALPVLFRSLDPTKRIGLSYAAASGLMFAASVYNLLLPAFTLGAEQGVTLRPVVETLIGLLSGCAPSVGAQPAVPPSAAADEVSASGEVLVEEVYSSKVQLVHGG